MESGWASCILLTIDISKSWAVPMISSNGPFFGDACQYTVSLFPQALERERKRQEGDLSLPPHTLSFFQFSVFVLAEPPWVYEHGGNVSHVCETLVKHGRLWSSN